MEPRVTPHAEDEVVEIFDGEEPAPDSWASLLPESAPAAPGDGAWAPPAPLAPTGPREALPAPAPFDWGRVELPPPPVVAAPDEGAGEQIEIFDGDPAEEPAPAVAAGSEASPFAAPGGLLSADEEADAAGAFVDPPAEREFFDAPAEREAFVGTSPEPVAVAPAETRPGSPEPEAGASAAETPPPSPEPEAAASVADVPHVPAIAGTDAAAVPLPAPTAPLVAAPPERTPPPQFAADVPTDGGDVLSLFVPPPAVVPAEPPARDVDRLVAGARDLFALGDFTGALELLREATALDPQHGPALDLLARTEDTLVQMYESKLGRLTRTPRVLLQPDEVVWLNLDHRAGFVLAQIDGRVTLEDIFALSGMSRLDTAKILVELIEQGAIAS